MNNEIWLRLIKPSTSAFYQEGKRLSNYSFGDWLHGYFYSRWTYFYISVGTGEHRLTRLMKPIWKIISNIFHFESNGKNGSQQITMADTYHGKVVPLEEASQLVSLNKSIDLGDLEQVIPYNLARDIVLTNPEHIVALECPCRAARAKPCLPLDVCLIIGDPFASFIAEHHPRRSRWINQQEALEILKAEDDRGHVHHAFFKDAMLGRFYAICNCCSCCCGAMQAWRHGIPMLAASGYEVRLNQKLCLNCGRCVQFCQFKALSMQNNRLVVDEAKCMGCGACISKCEQHAHSLVPAPERGIPLEIRKLIHQMESHQKLTN